MGEINFFVCHYKSLSDFASALQHIKLQFKLFAPWNFCGYGKKQPRKKRI